MNNNTTNETREKLFSKKKTKINWSDTLEEFFDTYFGVAFLSTLLIIAGLVFGIYMLAVHLPIMLWCLGGLLVLLFIIYAIRVFRRCIKRN